MTFPPAELPNIGTPPGSVLSDIILWFRRIVKAQSDQEISDTEIVNYINRFYQYDMPARLQLFELKRQYVFETVPNVNMYQVPFAPTAINDDSNSVRSRQGYQNLLPPAYCDGIQLGYFQSNDQFYSLYPEFVFNETIGEGDGSIGPFEVTLGQVPVLRGFVDDLGYLTPYVFFNTSSISGVQQYIVDGGDGILYATDATFQNGPLGIGTVRTATGNINYENGICVFFFDDTVTTGQPVYAKSSPYSPGFPRIMLYFNNIIKLFPVPDRQYKIAIDSYVTPAQFLETTESVPFSYMSEYIARGAARKSLSDVADIDLFNFYEQFFREQENQVLRRTDRQRAVTRTPTIFSGVNLQNGSYFRNF